ncbi:hypothetical protein JCM10296v2_000294 [Rhodotorula toruloides]
MRGPVSSTHDRGNSHAQLRTQRWKRPNVWLGAIIPSLLLVFALKGYTLVLLEITPLLWSWYQAIACGYAIVVHIALFLTGYSYFAVFLQSRNPPKLKEPPVEVQEKRVIFACDEQGEPIRCYRDSCGGAWQSLRSRHCADCATCRPNFDHHCAFVSNCIAQDTMKPFFTFLVWAAILLSVALVPFVPLEFRSAREVVRTTWNTAELREEWWSRKLSWAGGPVWRYAGGLLLGYCSYQKTAHERPLLVSDITTRTLTQDGTVYAYDVPLYPSLAVPQLGTLAVVFFALFITLIALAMIFVIVRNTRLGTSAIQTERTRLWRSQDGRKPVYDARVALWVPLDAGDGVKRGAVVFVEPDTPLFDLGASENWRRVMGEKWWQWFVPWVPSRASDLHDLNPRVVEALRLRARKER